MNNWTKAVSALLVMLMLFASTARAYACIAPIEREDRTISATIDPGREVPLEYSFRSGDLILISSNKGEKITVVKSPGSEESLLKLDVQDYERLTSDIHGMSPRWDFFKKYPMPGTVWSHYVAGKPGVVFIKIKSSKQTDWVRVVVTAKSYVPSIRNANELTQLNTLSFMFHDFIEIELPGSLSAGWQVSAEKDVGMKLLSVVDVSPSERVRLRFTRGRAQTDIYGEKRLEIRSGGETFTFTVRQQATPTC